MYNVLAISNRKLCTCNFFDKLEEICTLKEKYPNYISSLSIILREKDLDEVEYKILAKEALNICKNYNIDLILHTHFNVAKELDIKNIHVSFSILKNNPGLVKSFKCVGVSIHTIAEAIESQKLGASYIIAGHIFKTDCKKDLEPRGLSFLNSICNSVNIPVYAIGGINKSNCESVVKCGSYGICLMSSLMK